MADADIIVDLTNGDAGKGATVDESARRRKPDWVIRYSGGAQCAHNVVTPEGVHHCFQQFNSALLAHPDTKTFLSKDVLFDPFLALQEQKQLATLGIKAKLHVDPDALVVTPWHVAMNQLREIARGAGRHGSCGMGIGEARGDDQAGKPSLRVWNLDPSLSSQYYLRQALRAVLDQKVADLKELLDRVGPLPHTNPMADLLLNESFYEGVLDNLASLYPELNETLFETARPETMRGSDYVIFEGAQGVLLDEWVGFFPHVTRTSTTSRNAEKMAADLGMDTQVVGVLRAFSSRHGAGPFPSEEEGTREWALEGEHNALGPWQGTFRTGWFDFPLARYAIRANGTKPDKLVLTCLDRLPKQPGAIRSYVKDEKLLVVPPLSDPMEDALAQASANTEFLSDPVLQRLDFPSGQVREQFFSPEELSATIRARLSLQEGWDSYSPVGGVGKVGKAD